jgi:hypothetical protein
MSRRSRSIEIGFVAVVASAALSSCNPDQAYHRDWQQCVDKNNVVVEDRLCDQHVTSGVGYSPGYYHWLYTPRPYYGGDTILGGYPTPRPNMGVEKSSNAVRGGFGSSAHFGGGG